MKIEEIIKKYMAGESSMEEEKELLESREKLDPALKAWSQYVQNSKKQAPEGLVDTISVTASNRGRVIKMAVFAAAASILLLLGFYLGGSLQKQENKEMSLSEKQEKLAEAYAMFDDSENIIYEDDLIILYTE